MEYRFKFEPRAVEDALAIRHWIDERFPDRADAWYRGLLDEIETLKTLPRRCPRAPESGELGIEVRELLYGNRRRGVHRVLFTIDGDVVRILAIEHSSRGTA